MRDLAKACFVPIRASGPNRADDIDTTSIILQQQVFYSLLNLFKKQSVPEGYVLLQMLQIYLELGSLIGLNVHVERTLSMIESELLRFNEALKVSI